MDSPQTVKSIAWQEVFPWLIILRSLPVATSLSVWIIATIAVVLTPIGWLASELIFVSGDSRTNDAAFQDPEFIEFVSERRSPYRGVFSAAQESANYVQVWGARLSGPQMAFERLVEPVRRLFDRDMSFRKFCYLMVGVAWTIAVWSVCGCAITRICLLRLTRDDSAGLDDAFEFAQGKIQTALLSIFAPLLGLALALIPCALFGLLFTFDLGAALGGLGWIVILSIASAMTLVLFALMFGWPLIICAISAENQNALDAVTRGFTYVLQRPIHYAFYAAISVLAGGICWLIVAQLAVGTIQMAAWSASWGANVVSEGRMDQMTSVQPLNALPVSEATTAPATVPPDSAPLRFGKLAMRFWNGLISTLAVAFLFGQFWCLASSVYLLLRHDYDETEMDEIFTVERNRSYDLPPLRSDNRGIPEIQPLDESPLKSDPAASE